MYGPYFDWMKMPADISDSFRNTEGLAEGNTKRSRWIRRIEIAVYAYLAMLVVAAVAFITWIEGNGAI